MHIKLEKRSQNNIIGDNSLFDWLAGCERREFCKNYSQN